MKMRNLLEMLQAMTPQELDSKAACFMIAENGEWVYAEPCIKYAPVDVDRLGISAGQPLIGFTQLPDQPN